MLYSTLPDGQRISKIGFGASSFWAKKSFNEAEAVRLIAHAFDRGINYFDCSPSYGNGEAELRLAKLTTAVRRQDIVLSSKFGAHTNSAGAIYKNFCPNLMLRSVEGTLRRLNIDYLDMLFLHGPRKDDLNSALIERMTALKSSGKVKWIGVLSDEASVVEATYDLPIDANMIQYNVVDRRVEHCLDDLQTRARIIINTTIMAQGVFDLRTFIPTSKKSLWYLLRTLKNNPMFVRDAIKIQRFCAQEKITPVDFTIGFALNADAINSGLMGTTRLANLDTNLKAIERLSDRKSAFAIRTAAHKW